jgi:hypothetical protein
LESLCSILLFHRVRRGFRSTQSEDSSASTNARCQVSACPSSMEPARKKQGAAFLVGRRIQNALHRC